MNGLFKKINRKGTLLAGSLAAVLFCIPVFIFIRQSSYEQTWLLYLGSFLFLTVNFIHTIYESKKRRDDESILTLAFLSHVTTLIGIFIACILCFVLLTVLVPGYVNPGPAGKVLTGDPVNSVHDKTNGLSFQVFMAATIVNFSVGSFSGIILPFAVKRNQKKAT